MTLLSLRARKLAQPPQRLLEWGVVVTVVGVLAAVLLPQASGSAEAGQGLQVRAALTQLRQVIMRYRAEHGGLAPGYPEGDAAAAPAQGAFIDQLCRPSDAQGRVAEARDAVHRFGPYLERMPVNPLNGSATVLFVTGHQPLPAAPQGPHGWVYQPATGIILANVPGGDAAGVEFFDY